jgi:hypothetical protein
MTVSVPQTHPGDIIQVTDKAHGGFPAILLVHEVRAAHVEARQQYPLDLPQGAPVRLKPGQFVVVGAAHLLPAELAKARAASIETAALVAKENPGNSAGQKED